jgi:hypothetical protein
MKALTTCGSDIGCRNLPDSLPITRAVCFIEWELGPFRKAFAAVLTRAMSRSIRSAKTCWSSSKVTSPQWLAFSTELVQRFVDADSSFSASTFQMSRSHMGSDPVSQVNEASVASPQR